jgi:hypothetical protein
MEKFNIGDKVMVKYLDDLIADYGTINGGASIKGGPADYKMGIEVRRSSFGKFATIVDTSSCDGEKTYVLKDWSDGVTTRFNYPAWALVLVEKAVRKKKMTVAEIEKSLGYGVEVVKG